VVSVSSEQVENFTRDGVVLIRGLLTPGEVERARAGIEAVMQAPGPLGKVASSEDDPGLFFEDFCRRADIPEIDELARCSAAPEVSAALMATPEVRLYHDHVLVKEGRTLQRTPWHQDQPYYNVNGRGVSAWIPVDPVPAAGCLELLAGSHLGPWLMPRTFLDREAKWFPEGSLAEIPDVEADREAFDIRCYEMEPGDAIFFDFLTVHGAPGFPFADAGACFPSATCRRGRDMRRASGVRHPRSTVLLTSLPMVQKWITPSFPSYGPAASVDATRSWS
jgi:ectoine hydroxylase-related dioxygenase (phytanoyl-CoA dioxygenase family)